MVADVIAVRQYPWPDRLYHIFEQLNTVIQTYRPETVGIERVFVGKNPSSALKLGQARGAALAAVLSHQLPVGEYSPRDVKLTTVGYGGADKQQMQHMVKLLLALSTTPATDAADALAIAMCHGLRRRIEHDCQTHRASHRTHVK